MVPDRENSGQPIPLLAGFECSSHRRSDGARVDIIAATHHDRLVYEDFRLVARHGMTTVREGARWHIIEAERGLYDWTSIDVMVDAAQRAGVSIIWDLLHFGLPDWVNPFHPDFPRIFEEFAIRFAERVGTAGHFVPVNEISFMTWAAGDVEYMYPYSTGRGPALKRALCDASIRAIKAIRYRDPAATVYAVEPLIAVRPTCAETVLPALKLERAQFEAVDILTGQLAPELGGSPELIDIIGVNHYPHSQWYFEAEAIDRHSADWTPLSRLLKKVHDRYQKPLLMSETGCEGDDRSRWFNDIVAECERARADGVPITGICLYPILSHIAWTGERFCPNGLFDGDSALREPHRPLLDAINVYHDQTVYA